jgi:hypothetical protein
MRRAGKIAAVVGLLVAVAAAGLWYARGPSGASKEFGGSIEASLVPEFPTQSPERWVNGQPQTLAAARGSVVLIEAWAPG